MIRVFHWNRYVAAEISWQEDCHISVKSEAGHSAIGIVPHKISSSVTFALQAVAALPVVAGCLADKLLQQWGGNDKTDKGIKPIVLKMVRGNESDFQF